MSTPVEPPADPGPQPSAGWMPLDATPLPPGPPLPYEPPRRRPRGLIVLAGLMAILLAVGGGVGIGWTLARLLVSPQFAAIPGLHIVPPAATSGGTSASGDTLSKVEAAVVDIDTTVETSSGTGQAAGTGLLLTSGGEILTNNHVIADATRIKVAIQGRTGEYNAHVLGADPTADVALLQVEGVSGLTTVKVAPASSVHVGEAVIALGNALGQGGTPSVTEGTVTALNQGITATEDNGSSEQLTGLIESDAPISPGDSGGALVDAATGQLVGMITAGQRSGFRSSTSNLGYAVPATTAMDVVKQIRAGHATSEILVGQPGYIGVQVRDLDANTAAQLGLGGTSGVLVVGVQAGSPADQAGVAANAVITAVNGTATPNLTALGSVIHSHHPGQRITVTWTDQNGSHTAAMTLVSGPAV